jgi:hypothetical protein
MAEERRPEGRHQALAELADRQHGVVSARQLQRLGYSYDAISDAAAAAHLHRLHRGVYAVGRRRIDWSGRCLAAVLASAPAFASHASAAWLWGLLRYAPERIDVTAPTRRHPKAATRLHHARLLPPDVGLRDGIPVTSVARTVLDLAAVLSPDRLERVLERSEELRLFDLAAVDELLGRTGHHRGAARLREALAIYRGDPAEFRSRLERRFLALVRKAGLPRPAMNFAFAGYELDAYWARERFAVELDVYETHGSRAAFERDRVRQEELKLIGVEMIRLTGRRLEREPVQAIERLGALLAARRHDLAGRR